ncbi:type II secretion system F family protein [Clostridiaceae bacterium OttesenSCG-928-D20]|nr:type II secretion system F family protein [Clostridiaceae bacterium OttesenSCG-928-D20]
MKKKELSSRYISEFTGELALLVGAGVTVSDGIETLAADFPDNSGFLASLLKSTQEGMNFYDSLSKTEMVPEYMLSMIKLGEVSGKLDTTLVALSDFYDSQAKLKTAITSALAYPVVLILMLAAVVTVLITKVLPIFAEVFGQMGAQLPKFSIALINFGRQLSSVATIVIWVFAGIIIISALILIIPSVKKKVFSFFKSRFGATGIFKWTLSAKFAKAMTTAISSGLDAEQSIILAGDVVSGVKKTDAGIEKCKAMLKEGESTEKALEATGIFSIRDTRLLTIGQRTGSTESVMTHIANRSEERAIESIETTLGKVEPTLVIIISIVVSAVLLSVMLPLTGIMSSLG